MKELKSLLEKRTKALKISLDDKDVYYIFRRVIQEEFGAIGAEKFAIDYFGKKLLVVKCESSAWANELWMNKERIIRKINEKIGEDIVERIKTKNS